MDTADICSRNHVHLVLVIEGLLLGPRIFAFLSKGVFDALQIDEAFTHNDELKKSVVDVDPFAIVNRLRKDRDKMVEDYSNYKLIFQCLGYYGSNRRLLNQFVSKNQIGNFKKTGYRISG